MSSLLQCLIDPLSSAATSAKINKTFPKVCLLTSDKCLAQLKEIEHCEKSVIEEKERKKKKERRNKTQKEEMLKEKKRLREENVRKKAEEKMRKAKEKAKIVEERAEA